MNRRGMTNFMCEPVCVSYFSFDSFKHKNQWGKYAENIGVHISHVLYFEVLFGVSGCVLSPFFACFACIFFVGNFGPFLTTLPASLQFVLVFEGDTITERYAAIERSCGIRHDAAFEDAALKRPKRLKLMGGLGG